MRLRDQPDRNRRAPGDTACASLLEGVVRRHLPDQRMPDSGKPRRGGLLRQTLFRQAVVAVLLLLGVCRPLRSQGPASSNDTATIRVEVRSSAGVIEGARVTMNRVTTRTGPVMRRDSRVRLPPHTQGKSSTGERRNRARVGFQRGIVIGDPGETRRPRLPGGG